MIAVKCGGGIYEFFPGLELDASVSLFPRFSLFVSCRGVACGDVDSSLRVYLVSRMKILHI